MPAQFTLPPDTRFAGGPNPPADMNSIVDALVAMGVTYNILNALFSGGADPTGVTDSTAAIQAALNGAPSGTTVVAPPGIYKISAPLVMATANVSLIGFGLGNTNKTGGSVLLMSGTFSGNAGVSITAFSCQAINFTIFGNSTTTT